MNILKSKSEYNERCRRLASQIMALTRDNGYRLTLGEIILNADRESMSMPITSEQVLGIWLDRAKAGKPMSWMV